MFYPRLVSLLLLISLPTVLSAAEYVGAKQCKNCHQQEYTLWQGSHHDMAMKHADENSVLANFNDVSLKLSSETSRFYKKGKQYWVNIQGPDGKLHDYQIKYTFGFEPLQQYMVEFNDGRVQLIPYAWDSRSKAVSAGLICTLNSPKNTRSFTGPIPGRTGITCAPTVTRLT